MEGGAAKSRLRSHTTWHRWPVYRFTIHEEVTVERRDRYLNERYRPLSRRHEQGRWINRGKCETIRRRTVLRPIRQQPVANSQSTVLCPCTIAFVPRISLYEIVPFLNPSPLLPWIFPPRCVTRRESIRFNRPLYMKNRSNWIFRSNGKIYSSHSNWFQFPRLSRVNNRWKGKSIFRECSFLIRLFERLIERNRYNLENKVRKTSDRKKSTESNEPRRRISVRGSCNTMSVYWIPCWDR